MLSFTSSSKSKGRSGSMADPRASRTLPIPTRIMPSPPRLPLPQGLRLASAGHESDSFFESVTRSCGLLEQVKSPETVTMSNPHLVPNPRSASSSATSVTRSHAIQHGYTSSSSSLASTSSNSSSSSSSSQSSQYPTSCFSGSSSRRSTLQERRRGAYFTKIVIYREDQLKDCFVYAPSRVSSLTLDEIDCHKGSAPAAPGHAINQENIRSRPAVSPLTTASSNGYEEDDEGEEEVLEDDESHDGYSRPSSSMSIQSDPFEYSAYLSRPACQKLDRSLSRASSVTIRPTKRDSVTPKAHPSSPSPGPTDTISNYSAYLSQPLREKSECSLSRASSVTIRPTKRDLVVLDASSPPPGPTPRMGPPESVHAALRALKSIQAGKSFLFSNNVEDVGDECLSDVHWTPEEFSEVGIAL
ncbi:uncharacterized protein MELLADRAFT_106953 [Melampsora larici-populina 98AG31]|uniref:Uncharacterized protein n=1 Tax=Melampsora larici-populina (strain 98AG31 / pathotype 3-4-7) TaxID=747676 RepID=F4RN66_MELLP|nr:uncharacterized protein MELLADRAFT_106953 [Melampsora larici-populina 98AG31]EGG06246.1 hypothetical protein MELLADRAFT_106953 [Melampsora larici-populina 98AG31]